MTDFTFPALAGEYTQLWDTVSIGPEHANEINRAAQTLNSLKTQFYDPVSAATNVPWFVIGLIHCLECGFNTHEHLHNGDPLGRQTTHVPAGRPTAPPFDDWAHSAIDALTMEGFREVDRWTVERIAYQLEKYNGFGYRRRQPKINSPYLWSFTNQYAQGKFIGDGVFSPTAVSDQVGAMALLKTLVDQGLSVQRQDGPPAPPPPPPQPVPTGKFEADGKPFVLRARPDTPASDDAPVVMLDTPIDKIAEVGDGSWWQIKASWPDESSDTGFAKKEWLRPLFARAVVEDAPFTQACLDAARLLGTSAHFLIALADAETGIANIAAKTGAFGPFALTADDWKTCNDQATTGLNEAGRFDPYSQPAVAALMVVKLTADLQALLPDKRLPSSEELYLARVLGAKGVPKLLAAAPDAKVADLLVAPDYTPDEVKGIFVARASLLTSGITVQGLRSAVVAKIEAGFAKAVTDIGVVEPDLVTGPPPATDAAATPWMDKAKSQLGVTAAGNPDQVIQYFTATTLGAQPASTPWCAAFVSWCIKQSGKVDRVHVFSARAADWLQNGDKLEGPQFGAVGVTKPLVAGDSGHVGFVTSFDGRHITMLGGNQSHSVCEKPFRVDDFVGFRMM
jgi:uncharacterized protein (TIGR02594 family)